MFATSGAHWLRRRSPSPVWPQLRRLLQLARPYRSRLAVSLMLSLGAVAVGLAMPLGLRELLNTVALHRDRAALNELAVLLLVLYVLRGILNFVGPYLLRVTGEEVVLDLRNRIYAHIHSLDIGYFANHRVGDLTSRLSSDVGAVRGALTDASVSLALQAFRLCGSVAVMAALNWRLCVLVLGVGPAATIVSRAFSRRILVLSREYQDALAHSNATAQEALSGIRLVQTFGRAPFEIERYRHATQQMFTVARRSVRTGTSMGALVEFLFTIVTVMIFWYGGREVLHGRLTPGDLVAFMFYSQGISSGIGEILQLYTTFTAAAGASTRLFELLDTRPSIEDAPGAREVVRARGKVSFERVSFSYARRASVLRDVTFTVEAGERVALLGASGAGKTTLLNLVPRLLDPDHGTVCLDDVDVRRLTVRSLREQIAVVSQEIYLFSGSIEDNIRYGRLDASSDEIVRAAHAANADEFITGLPEGYQTAVGEHGVKLSGGQRQRIAIARAILKDAPVLLLDEATSSVDGVSEARIQAALEQLQHGRTTFIVTHRLAAVEHMPRILVVQDGHVVEDGSHPQLVASRGAYWQLWSRRKPGLETDRRGYVTR